MAEFPTIKGYELKERIGSGGCGDVYRAVLLGQNRECAVKVFDGMSVNRQYLSFCLGKLFSQPAHERLIGLVGGDLNAAPYYVSTAFEPRSLETEAASLRGAHAWDLIRQVAEGVGYLHRQGLVHCNLNFENVRIAGADGAPEVKLTDFGTGLLGGVHHLELGRRPFTMSPEQLRHPEQITGGAGERWDVYSFGALAYRLLTGRHPRAERSISDFVTMAEGANQAGARPRPEDFAALIEAEPEISWPDASDSGAEAKRREVIVRCLALDPAERFGDLRDVLEAFAAIDRTEAEAAVEKERDDVLRKARGKVGRARGVAVLLLLLLAAAGGGAGFFWKKWQDAVAETNLVRQELGGELEKQQATAERLAGEAEQATLAMAAAQEGQRVSREAAGRFFEQLIGRAPETERDRVALEESLDEAEAFFREFLDANEGRDEVVLERVRAEHNLARILLLEGRLDEAVEELSSVAGHLAGWLDKGESHPERPAALERLAGVKVELARLQLERGDGPGAQAAVADLERRFVPLLDAGSATATMRLKLGEGRFHKARALEWSGDVIGAARTFGECAGVLGEFASQLDVHPDAAARRAEAMSEAGRILRQSGELKAGAQQQVEAVEELLELTGMYGGTAEYQFLLAKAYADLGMAVGEMGNAGDASRAHTESINILAELVKQHPEEPEYRRELAREYGEVAALVRDTGENEKALEYQSGAVAFLKDLAEKHPESVRYAIDYSREQGRYAELMRESEKKAEALGILEEAVGRIEPYGDVTALTDPENRALRTTLAGLYGSLGHAFEEERKKDEAIAHFAKAVEHWKKLVDGGAKSATVEEGLAWSQQRLKRLQP